MDIPYIVEERADTGLNNVKLGIWLFLASEVMLFGALFSSYVLLRLMATEWPLGVDVLNVPLGAVNTAVLIGSSVTMVMAYASLRMDNLAGFKRYLGLTIALSLVFMIIKGFEYNHEFDIGNFPWTSTYLAIYYTMTGLHALHIIGGVIVNSYLSWVRARRCGRPTRPSSRIGSRRPASTGTSSIWCGSSCSRCSTCCRTDGTS